MIAMSLSSYITTPKVEESRDFYVKHFAARVTFDCGWCVNLEFGQGASLQFMAPQGDQAASNPAGLTYNFCVAEIDSEYQSLTASGLTAIMPLGDHPWGDCGLSVQDPNGIVRHIYAECEPSAEFNQYYKS